MSPSIIAKTHNVMIHVKVYLGTIHIPIYHMWVLCRGDLQQGFNVMYNRLYLRVGVMSLYLGNKSLTN